jgi:transcriptional regulator with PAS, ATPase and Fis domain
MDKLDWIREFPAAVTVVDAEGIIVAMNAKSALVFREDGGEALIGTQVLDCHPEPARTKLAAMMKNRSVNCYTIEKNGKWKMIYQAPWYVAGDYRGFVEISMDIPQQMPHFIRT